MGAPTGEPADEQREQTAPDHIVDLLIAVRRPRAAAGAAPPDTVVDQRIARAEARAYADRIWGEAWHAGAAWGLARNAQPIQITLDSGDAVPPEWNLP